MSDDLELKRKHIKEELEQLNYEFKVDIPRRIAEARAYGDLKENAEYHAARERQGFVKARITQLSSQLSQLQNLSVGDIPRDRIGFGSTVTVRDLESDDTMVFTFVAPNEVKPADGKISLSTPYGQALQNKIKGDEVVVTVPAGKKKFVVEKFVTIHGDEF